MMIKEEKRTEAITPTRFGVSSRDENKKTRVVALVRHNENYVKKMKKQKFT